MADQTQPLVIRDLRAGRNNVDPPDALSDRMVADAINGHWYNSTTFTKRNGESVLTTTGGIFPGTISSLFRHVASTDETAAELWATDDSTGPVIGRLTGGTAWVAPTLKDATNSGSGWQFTWASLDGKLFIAYQSLVDRLHVWDPVSNSVRRTGLAAMLVPTVANTGVGTYAAVGRYYRTRATEQRAGVTVRRSEASPIATFTPSGTGTAARVTKGTAPGEGETHWEVEASPDGIIFYRIATVVIGTTTYDDSAVVTTYPSNPLSAVIGTYTLQKSYKFIAADQNRLLGFGSWTSTNPQNRLEWSAVLGSSDIGDAERVPIGNYQALDENDSGQATGLFGPVNGSFFALKYRQFWKLTPSGNPTQPYNTLCLSKRVGAVGPQAVEVGEDETGNAALYFLSQRGPYRYGAFGLEYLGKPVEDKTVGANSGTTLSLAAQHVVAHTLWYPDLRQVWFFVATGTSNDPDTILRFSVGRKEPFGSGNTTDAAVPDAWSIDTGGLAASRCSCLFSNTVGATMSRDLKPYVGAMSAVNRVCKGDTTTLDVATTYQAYVKTKQYRPWGDRFDGSITGAVVRAKAATGVILQLTVIKDDGVETQTGTVDLTPVSPETSGGWVERRFGSAINVSNARVVAFQLGDAAAVNNSWQASALIISWVKGTAIAA